MTAPDTAHRRPVRSYVLREGRFTDAQRSAFERLWPRYGLALPDTGRLDPAALFGSGRPLFLEIGFGNGGALAALAAARPQHDFIGLEVHRPGIGRLLRTLEREELENVRLLRHDAAEVVRRALPDACLDGVYLFFPDPWPKKKHHKRRLVQPPFAARLVRVLKPGGFVHMATDWEDYAQHMLAVLEAEPGLVNAAGPGGFVPRPEARPLTHFEQRGRHLGHGVWDLVFRRRG